MARRRASVPLNVFINGRHVGVLRRQTSGAIDFVYADAWLNLPISFPVSLSLPLRAERYSGAPVIAVLDNLLPDSSIIRRQVAEHVGARGTDPYSLLAALGHDCVGALQFLPDGIDPGPAGAIDGDVVGQLSSLAHCRRAFPKRSPPRPPLPAERDSSTAPHASHEPAMTGAPPCIRPSFAAGGPRKSGDRAMADSHGTPHFHNQPGLPSIKVAAKEFMCIGALPPFDHPHIFIDMGDETDIVCSYCSTRFVYDGALKTPCAPAECFYMPDDKAAA